jgi:hypothetical protein
MTLRPDETELVGQWIFDGTKMSVDETSRRIEHLTTEELEKVAVSSSYGDWEVLFRDPRDGRFWERTYPHGELQGGGPPRLKVISEANARTKYHFPMSMG